MHALRNRRGLYIAAILRCVGLGSRDQRPWNYGASAQEQRAAQLADSTGERHGGTAGALSLIRDLLQRAASAAKCKDGGTGVVFQPSTYSCAACGRDDLLALGKKMFESIDELVGGEFRVAGAAENPAYALGGIG